MTTERVLQARCLKYARKQGVWARNITTPAYAGMPDCMFLYKGMTMFVEFKSPKGTGKLSAMQWHNIEELQVQGFPVFVVNDFDIFSTSLDIFMSEADEA
tara:strand:+ start:672 stop:971 length:300 start_codon:yes stop_codon:yes gene_type:complete